MATIGERGPITMNTSMHVEHEHEHERNVLASEDRTQTRAGLRDDTILGVSEHLNNMRIRQTAACAARMQNCHSQAERQARYQLQQFNREPAVWNPNSRDKPAQAASNASAQPHMSTPIISLNGRRTHLHVSAIPSTCTTRTNHDLTLL